jgi:hypothetical protein
MAAVNEKNIKLIRRTGGCLDVVESSLIWGCKRKYMLTIRRKNAINTDM